MSVPKNKRDLSELEFYHQALVIRKEITQLLLRDFGIKDKVRDITLSFNQMEKEDAEIFFDIAKKYNYNKVIEEYPEWLINHCRNNLLVLCHNLIMNIASAYSINPVNLYECEQKRMIQNYAIGNCDQILQEMTFIIDTFPIDANKYMRYVEMVLREIELLKSWRRKGNKVYSKIKDQLEENS